MKPNILLLLSDQHRHDWLPWTPALRGLVCTPHLEVLAARGVRFTNAVCPSPLCGPSRACLASGVEYDRCGMVQHERNWPVETLGSHYQLMRDLAGYHVTGCGKFDLRKHTNDPGVTGRDHVAEWGFSHAVNTGGKWDSYNRHRHGEPASDPYFDALDAQGLRQVHLDDYARREASAPGACGIPLSAYGLTDPTPLPDPLYIDNWVATTAAGLLDRVPSSQPWYCVVNFSGPHDPLDITRSMEAQVADRSGYPQPVRASDVFNAEGHEEARRAYTAMVENIDARAGDLIELLSHRGELERTVIIYTSDHGEMLGDHRRWAKKAPYHASVGIPMIIAGPGIRQGVVSDAPVSLIDLAATALDYAGVPVPEAMEAQSLRPLLEGRATRTRQVVRSGLEHWRMVYDSRYKLIRGFDPNSEGHSHGSARDLPLLLFDRENDPDELHNIARENKAIVAALQPLLAYTKPLAAAPK